MEKWILTIVCLFQLYNGFHAGRPKVSWKECNIDVSSRHDCGFAGIGEEKCYQRGCCWSEDTISGSPKCYYSNLMTEPQCFGPLEDRTSCGFSGIRKDQCLALDCCWQPKNDLNTPWCYRKAEIEIQGECGKPAITPRTGSSRVVGGVEARPNSWPWQASLQSFGSHWCGASVINEYWLVSAAHCHFEPMTVVLGMHSLEEGGEQAIAAESLFPHEAYGNLTYLDSDIMLIKLREPITFTDSISPVCLPEQDETIRLRTRCYITGWGSTELYGESPDKLQQADLPILDQDTCQEWYTEPQNWYHETNETIPVTDTMLCAGYEEGGKSGCHGDSGGPFVCRVEDKWKLFGAVSWGGKCGYERVASVFSKVALFRDWIQQTIQENS